MLLQPRISLLKLFAWLQAKYYTVHVRGNGLFTFTDPDFDSDSESNPIPVVSSYDRNLNATPCYIIQCSHLLCSLIRDRYPNPAMWISHKWFKYICAKLTRITLSKSCMLWILSLLWLYVKIAIPTPAQFTAAFNSPNFSRAVAVAASTFSSDVTCEVMQKAYQRIIIKMNC